MRLPDLLATKAGRLTTFFMLYMTEGIPLGFTATAIATQMRPQGLGPGGVGACGGCRCPCVGVQVDHGAVRRRVLVGALRAQKAVDHRDADRDDGDADLRD